MAQFNVSLNVVQELPPSSERRIAQRERLILCAEAAVARDGLGGLRARDLASGIGCSVGAIYNLVADLDELALLVGQRTMTMLNAPYDEAILGDDASAEAFVGAALAYCRFAMAHRNRWRALFEFRMPAGKPLPPWFEADQMRAFSRLEGRLAVRLPQLDTATLRIRARSLFSAVHGIVWLGLEDKLVAMPPEAIEDELAGFVRTYLAGLELCPRSSPPPPGPASREL